MYSTKSIVKKVISQKQSSFFQEQNQCCLCGNELEIKTLTDSTKIFVEEQVNCTHCQVKIRNKQHKLQ